MHVKALSRIIRKDYYLFEEDEKDDLRFNVISNSISVISGRRKGDNKKLCVQWNPVSIKEFASPEIEPGTSRSAGQRLTH